MQMLKLNTNTSIAGIGSRKCPPDKLEVLTKIGSWCLENGVLVNSGHAEGSDYAFENGAQTNCVAFLPWHGFNGHLPLLGSGLVVGDKTDLDDYVDRFHYNHKYLSPGARKLMRRNVCQVLGLNGDSPVSAIVCWTPGGKLVGGTAFAMKLGQSFNVPIVNIHDKTFQGSIDSLREILNVGD